METFVRPFTSVKPIMHHKLWFCFERLLAFSATKGSLSRVNPLMNQKLRLPFVRLVTTSTLKRPFSTVGYLVKKQFWFVQKSLFTVSTLVVVDFSRALVTRMSRDRGWVSIMQMMTLIAIDEITCWRLGRFVHRWNTLGLLTWKIEQRLVLKTLRFHFTKLPSSQKETSITYSFW